MIQMKAEPIPIAVANFLGLMLKMELHIMVVRC